MSYIDDLKEIFLDLLQEGKVTYKTINSIEPVKDWLDINYNEIYVLADGFGSIYTDNKSIGYFVYGTIITFKRINDSEYTKAFVEGHSFRVTQDASFGNTPSKSNSIVMKKSGEIPLNRFPRIVKLSQVIDLYKV